MTILSAWVFKKTTWTVHARFVCLTYRFWTFTGGNFHKIFRILRWWIRFIFLTFFLRGGIFYKMLQNRSYLQLSFYTNKCFNFRETLYICSCKTKVCFNFRDKTSRYRSLCSRAVGNEISPVAFCSTLYPHLKIPPLLPATHVSKVLIAVPLLLRVASALESECVV